MRFIRAKYKENNRLFETRNFYTNELLKSQNVNTVIQGERIFPDENGFFIGVYCVDNDIFIVDDWYDMETGWIWLYDEPWNYGESIEVLTINGERIIV